MLKEVSQWYNNSDYSKFRGQKNDSMWNPKLELQQQGGNHLQESYCQLTLCVIVVCITKKNLPQEG